MNLFLDDVRVPNESWRVVRNCDEFVEVIESEGLPNNISFDHDLGTEQHYKGEGRKYNKRYAEFEEKTGLHAAKWLVEFCMDNGYRLPTCYIHSANPVGAENIEGYLTNACLMNGWKTKIKRLDFEQFNTIICD